MIICRSSGRCAHIGRRWTSSAHQQHGSAAVELVVLVPALLLLLLVVVFAGRLAQANTTVRHAADQAARAASQVSDGAMATRATEVALAEIHAQGLACLTPMVTVDRSATTVGVTVSCEVNRQALAPLAPGRQTVTASSVEVVDVLRGDGRP
ncbi:MAG: TadE/TadG family type IV pilus assembly protein [Acidimicrobiia bacterium]